MIRSLTLNLLLFVAVLAGCNNGGTSEKLVAIVDLEKVLKMTGVDLEMDTAIQERENQLRTRLITVQQKLDEQWLQKKNEYGEDPNDDQKRELQQILAQLNAQNQQARNQAGQEIASFQQQLFEAFQYEVSPISLEVAKEQGYTVVLGKNPSILAYDTTIDITDAVIERVKQVKSSRGNGNGGSAAPMTPGSAAPSITPPVNITPPLNQNAVPAITPPAQPPATTPEKQPEATPPAAPEKPAEKPAEEKPAPEKAEETQPAPEATTPDAAPSAAENKPATPAETPAPETETKPAEEPAAESN